jgi:hypothetical protein
MSCTAPLILSAGIWRGALLSLAYALRDDPSTSSEGRGTGGAGGAARCVGRWSAVSRRATACEGMARRATAHRATADEG